MTIIKNAVVNAGGNPIMLQGLLINRPNFGVIGRLFVSTDTLVIYRDTGTAWVVLGAVSSTPNLNQVLTIGNQSATTVQIISVQAGGQIILQSQVIAGSLYTSQNNFGNTQSVTIAGNNLQYQNNASYYNLTFPSKNGTFAVTTDLPTSGNYIPVLTPQNNCTSVTLISAVYSNINNVLNVNIVMDIKPTVAGITTGVQGITLPNTFTTYTIYQAIGVAFDVTTSAVVAVSGVRSATGNSIIGFLPVTNNVQRVSINISLMGTP